MYLFFLSTCDFFQCATRPFVSVQRRGNEFYVGESAEGPEVVLEGVTNFNLTQSVSLELEVSM